MNREILYRSPTLKVFANGRSNTRLDSLVVAFQYMQSGQHLDLPGFAEEFFEKHQVRALFVNCATNEWYQYEDLFNALSAVRTFASAWSRVVTYGSSMGGYAALRFAEAVGARSSIAIGPQYSPRSAVIAGENRFDTLVSRTDFLHENSYRASSKVDNYVVYDPLLRIDVRHVTQYRKDAKLLPIPIPCGGHTPTILLVECGMLSELILRLIAGTFSAPCFRTQLRRARASSPEYWNELRARLLEREKPDTANRVAEIRRAREGPGRLDQVESGLVGA